MENERCTAETEAIYRHENVCLCARVYIPLLCAHKMGKSMVEWLKRKGEMCVCVRVCVYVCACVHSCVHVCVCV